MIDGWTAKNVNVRIKFNTLEVAHYSEKHNNLLGIIDIGVGFLQYYEFTNKSILLRPQL